uniref:U-box domain-containing protein n=1 Tax=Oryza punctata TaxID=4537 RepID=A0A0E0LTV5_ORYPU
MSSSLSLLSRRRSPPRSSSAELELPVPPEFRCPISLDLMRDPVVGPTGITYDRAGIEAWLLAAGARKTATSTCPVTKGDLRADDLVPNHALRRVIQACDSSASSLVLDGVLAALVLVMPLDKEAIVPIGTSTASVALLASVAKQGDLQRRLQAVVLIREIVALSSCCSRNGGATTAIDLSDNLDGIIEVLVNTIRDPISPQATKASLVAAYHLALADDYAATRLAEAGLVPSLVELLIDGDRSTAEKALAALDATLASEAGRARARADALAVPVLVKKMFRVSDTATELVVSALHHICKKWHGEDEVGSPVARRSAVVEMVQVGAFQKVMMLLQVGCRDATKEKATELLKLMLKYETRGGGDCIDAMDFRGLKRVS